MRFYPENRAARVDRSKMTEEEWLEHKRKKDCEKYARWNARNPGKSNAALRRRRAQQPWWTAMHGAFDRAKSRGLDFDLTHEWAERKYTGFCALTGIPFIVSARDPAGRSGGRAYSQSLDRIDPRGGYTQDNCRFILFALNSFKGTMIDAGMYHIAQVLLAKRFSKS